MRFAVLAAAFALAACGQTATTSTDIAVDSTNACATSAEESWNTGSAGALTIVATTAGADCATATATLKVRDAQGEDLLTETFPVDHVMVLAGSTGQADMQTKITEWINDAGTTTSELADWPAGAAQPIQGEFPFYVEDGVTRDRYLAVRRANLPALNVVQGMESVGVWVLENGAFTKLGAQSFPG